MLTIFLLVVNTVVIVLGIYLFDYQVDSIINNPFAILLSIFVALIASFLAALFYMELFYIIYAKDKPDTSKKKHRIAKQIVSVPLHLFNVRTKVVGKENLPKDPRFLIYANHTSELDISILMNKLSKYPVAFLAKKAVLKYLSIGKWALSIGCIMLDRENNRRGAYSVSQVVKKVQNGSTMVIFPEGKIKREIGKLLRFRSGSFRIALESEVPLVPVSIVKDKQYNKGFWPMAKKFTIVIHEALLFKEFKTLKSRELSNKVRDIIDTELEWEENL